MIPLIRRLGPEDAPDFLRLRLIAVQTEPSAFADSPDEAALSVENTAAHLGEADHPVIGAFIDGALVGLIGLARMAGHKTRHKARLWGFFVAKHARRHGIGRQLVVAALAEARALPGITHVTLRVSDDHPEAKRLYERAGFEVYGCEPAALCVRDRFIDEHLMWMRLR